MLDDPPTIGRGLSSAFLQVKHVESNTPIVDQSRNMPLRTVSPFTLPVSTYSATYSVCNELQLI